MLRQTVVRGQVTRAIVRYSGPMADLAGPELDRGGPSHVRMLAGAGLDTWGGSPFVEERLALLGKIVFLLSFCFLVVFNGMLLAGGATVPMLITQANIWHLISSSS